MIYKALIGVVLGLDSRRLSSTNESGAKAMGVISRHATSGTKSLVNQFIALG
jgi:hypothetical protein